ncbi:MAG: L,D-transpeptidase, partial [Xanthobacteraceae bacterium]
QMPPEAVERIAELLSPGSSLVISDEGLGRETGRMTEFIVLTR